MHGEPGQKTQGDCKTRYEEENMMELFSGFLICIGVFAWGFLIGKETHETRKLNLRRKKPKAIIIKHLMVGDI